MKKIGFIALFSLILVAWSVKAQDSGTPLTGYDIIKKQVDQNAGFHDEKARGKMFMISAKGGQTVRAFEYKQLEKTTTEGNKAMIKIIEPPDLKGTGLLSYSNVGRDDDQWLYLPALKKTKRITGSAKSGRFIGSDFSYEDLSPREIDDFDYKLLREEPCGESSCYVVEITSKKGDWSYSKLVNWIRPDNFQNQRSDIYDKNGMLSKQATFDQYQQITGKYWRAYQITMKDLSKSRETKLVFEEIQIRSGLNSSDFSKNVLER